MAYLNRGKVLVNNHEFLIRRIKSFEIVTVNGGFELWVSYDDKKRNKPISRIHTGFIDDADIAPFKIEMDEAEIPVVLL